MQALEDVYEVYKSSRDELDRCCQMIQDERRSEILDNKPVDSFRVPQMEVVTIRDPVAAGHSRLALRMRMRRRRAE